MKGKIIALNRPRGMAAVAIDRNDYSILELLDGEVEIGDEISWVEHMPLGGGTARNHTSGEHLDVYFQNHGVTDAQLRQQLLYE